MTALTLPVELAPALRDRVLTLIEQVGLARPHPEPREGGGVGHRCVVCHQAGKLSGHHDSRDRIVWVHRGCHRRLHRAGRR